MTFNHCMIDLETGGTSPDHSPILQIAAVRFDPLTLSIDSEDMFDRCLFPLHGRYWDESTREWWVGQNRAVLQTILPRREPPELVLNDFFEWALKRDDTSQHLHFWSKPLSFDFPLLASHLTQVGLPNPFHYRMAMDVNTFVRAKTGDMTAIVDTFVPNVEGPRHNALVDVLHQISGLFEVIKQCE